MHFEELRLITVFGFILFHLFAMLTVFSTFPITVRKAREGKINEIEIESFRIEILKTLFSFPKITWKNPRIVYLMSQRPGVEILVYFLKLGT